MGRKKPLGSGNKREKSNGENSKTQDGKVAAETRDAQARDTQEPPARPNAPRRVGQAPRRTQGAAQDVVGGKSHCRMFAAGGSQGAPPAAALCSRECEKKLGRAHVSSKPFCKSP